MSRGKLRKIACILSACAVLSVSTAIGTAYARGGGFGGGLMGGGLAGGHMAGRFAMGRIGGAFTGTHLRVGAHDRRFHHYGWFGPWCDGTAYMSDPYCQQLY